jgi:hypothetical protein
MTGFLFVQSINAFLKAGVFRKGGVLVMLKLGFDENNFFECSKDIEMEDNT